MVYRSRGFTIIELVVVIVIISVLATIVSASVIIYIAKAKDAKRKQELQSFQIAMADYYEKNGKYPQPSVASGNCYTSLGEIPCSPRLSPPSSGHWKTGDDGDFDKAFIDTGIFSSLPEDPKNSEQNYYKYRVSADGQSYVLEAPLEGGTGMFAVGAGPKAGCLIIDKDGDGDMDGLDLSMFTLCNQPGNSACRWMDNDIDGILNYKIDQGIYWFKAFHPENCGLYDKP